MARGGPTPAQKTFFPKLPSPRGLAGRDRPLIAIGEKSAEITDLLAFAKIRRSTDGTLAAVSPRNARA